MAVRAMLCATAVLLAWLSFRFVERSLRRRDLGTSSPQIAAAGLTVSLAIPLCWVSLGDALHREPLPGDLASRTQRDTPENRFECHYRGVESLEAFPKPACNSTDDKPVRVVIWGDSHTLAWQPFAWLLAEDAAVAATSYTRDACAPAIGYDNGKRLVEAERCREFNARVLGRIQGVDTLIMTAYWPVDVDKKDFRSRFEATVQQVAPRVRRVILLGLTPNLRDAAPRCIRSGGLAECAVPRGEFDAAARGSREFLRSLQARYANVEYVELAHFFCDADACPVLKDGYGLYWDDDHVSSTAAKAFAKEYLSRRTADAVLSTKGITPRSDAM